MSIESTAAVGFGIIIKGDDSDTFERVYELCGNGGVAAIAEILETSGSKHLLVDVAGSNLFGSGGNDLVVFVKDTYRDLDIMSSGFAGAFRIDENGVSDEGIKELREFCAKIGLITSAFWIAWNSAS